MKPLIAFAIALVSVIWSGILPAPPVANAACMPQMLQGIVGGQTAVSGCTASYANEVLTAAIATAGPGVTEGDATTGWTNAGCVTFDTAGTAYSGSYALNGVANSANDKFSYTLSGLTDNQLYRLSFYVRHNGTGGDWKCAIGAGAGDPNTGQALGTFTSASTSYENERLLFRWNVGMNTLWCSETSDTNDGGVYVDYVSVTEVTPCLGDELHTSANAASLTNEANATTGWTAINTLDSFVSDSTGPADGTYHIKADATSNPAANNGFNIDLASAPFSLSTGTKYLVLFKAKHIGSGDPWRCGFNSSSTGIANSLYLRLWVPATATTYFGSGMEITYSVNYRYFVCSEYGTNNNGGMYLDSFTVKRVLSE